MRTSQIIRNVAPSLAIAAAVLAVSAIAVPKTLEHMLKPQQKVEALSVPLPHLRPTILPIQAGIESFLSTNSLYTDKDRAAIDRAIIEKEKKFDSELGLPIDYE